MCKNNNCNCGCNKSQYGTPEYKEDFIQNWNQRNPTSVLTGQGGWDLFEAQQSRKNKRDTYGYGKKR